MSTTFSQVKCGTCSQYFQSNDVVYGSLECGHTFHKRCLYNKFAEGSRICNSNGNCATPCYLRKCRRVYLDYCSYNWLYIKPEVFSHNARQFQKQLLSLGINRNGHNIYAARVFLSDQITLCYFNAHTAKIYADFECDTAYQSTYQFEFLDKSKDREHQYIWTDKNNSATHFQAATGGGYFKNNQKLLRIPR